jgi:general secretion pathway protein I
MIAVAVVGIGLVAAFSGIVQLSAGGAYLRDKTMAHWIAMNRLAEMRLAEAWPATGESDEEIEFADQRWHWSAQVTATDVPSLRRIDLTVSRKDEGPERVLARLAGFAGQPRVAGALPTPWTGAVPGEEVGLDPGEDTGTEEPPPDEDGGGGDTGGDEESGGEEQNEP